jgi:glutamate-1-semialdehyde 2,1-aminomutase
MTGSDADRYRRSRELLARAQASIPGGVTSSVRAGAVPLPLYFDRGAGSRLWDVDGNEYIDFLLAYGPSFLGHSPPAVAEALSQQAQRGLTFGAQHAAEAEAAERVLRAVPGAEKVMFASTGSEAVAVALRVARAYTNRPKVVKFQGHYHGWLDGMFASVGNAMSPEHPAENLAWPQTAGTSPGATADTLTCRWNDLEALSQLMAERGHEIAAVIVEPVNVNGGVILPSPGMLALIRDLTTRNGAVLIFDEVITGFRIALGGAQERYGIQADLAIFAKAIAGGFPVSAIAGSDELVSVINDGQLAHNGTFNGNPMGMAAVIATLDVLLGSADEIYPRLERLGNRLADGLAALSPSLTVRSIGPICATSFDEPADVVRIQDRTGGDVDKQQAFATGLIDRGIHSTGLWYLSTAHTEGDVDAALETAADVMATIT